MAVEQVFSWYKSRGWIVLSGGADAGGEIRSQVLGRLKSAGVVVYLGFSEDSGDEVLDDFEDLGAPSGYLVNVMEEDDDTIRTQIAAASLIVIDDSAAAQQWRDALTGATLDGIQEALSRGAVLLGEGEGAAVLGAVLLAEGRLHDGLAMMEHALILPTVASLAEAPDAQHYLDTEPDAVVIGIGVGSALALGPEGRIETWGQRQVTVALGRNYRT